MKFGAQVLQSDAMKKLEQLVQDNKETPGKATIGDEKVWPFPSLRYGSFNANGAVET